MCIITGYNVDKDKLPSKLVIPDTIGDKKVVGIGEFAFKECTGITTLDLSNCTSLTGIFESAFDYCRNVTTLNLPASLTIIDWHAFDGCKGITTLNLPAALTEIGTLAFNGCEGITTLNLPASLTEIGVWAFDGCTGIETVTFGKPDGWKAYKDLKYKDEIGSIDLSTPAKRLDALTKPRYKGGYCDCDWEREVTP